jgi:ADP-ribosylglycohydrolase
MSQSLQQTKSDRALGALLGLALGDAMGMPSQTLSRDDIHQHYGEIVDFVAPVEGHPVSHGLTAAQITDDTEQAFLLAAQLVASPRIFDDLAWARALLDWEADVKARGLHDLLGPSSKQSLEALLSGVSVEMAGKDGTTNGAAMRITPVGIATPFEPLGTLVDRVEATCRVTHNTSEAIAASSAIAAMVSAGVAGRSFEEAIPVALDAALAGSARGHQKGETDMAGRIRKALDCAAAEPTLPEFADEIGNSVASFHSVPAAFGIVRLAGHDPCRAAQLAANIGDDTDTIGAISAAMAGACVGASRLPADKIAVLQGANDLDFSATAKALLNLRDQDIQLPLTVGEIQ